MREELRETGIDIIGDVPWGTHFCQFYQTKKDLIDILVPYFMVGLENNEFCIWITSEPLNGQEVINAMKRVLPNFNQYLKRGQIEILPYTDWYLTGGEFDSKRTLYGWVDKLNQALAKGYEGLRLTGNTSWLEKKDWKSFTDYENEVDNVISKYRMIAVCTYSLDQCGANEVVDVISNHRFVLIRREGEWQVVESSKQRRAEDRIKESEKKYRELYEGSHDGFVIVDMEGHIKEFNRTYAEMLGYSEDELMRLTYIDLTPKKWHPMEAKIVEEQILQRGYSNLYEKEYIKKDGTIFPISLRTYLIRNPNGNPSGMWAFVRDITEHKRMEEELRKSRDDLEIRFRERTAELAKTNELLEKVFSSIDLMIAYMDKDFNFLRVNRAYAEADERTPEFYVGKNHFALFPNEENEAIFRKVLETGEPYFVYEKPFVYTEHPERGVTYWDWSLQPVKEIDGSVGGVVLSLVNVTERKEIENRTNATNALLNLFSKKSVKKDYFDAVIDLLRRWSGCRCVGIRVLNERGYIPYESYVGFSQEFWESENWLSVKQDQCACIRVITGNPESQDVTMMTTAGSFRCDNTVKFVGQLSGEEQSRFRGICVQNGFMSVAIIPIRYQEKTLGAIHLADEKEGKVPLKSTEFIESMVPLIGEAVNRFNLEEEIRESEARLRLLSSQLLTIQETERKRVAQELHDGIGQMLTAIKFKVEDILQQADKGNFKLTGKSLETLIPMIRESIDEVRKIQMDLRPSTLDDLGILATIGWFCREFEKIYSNIRVERKIDIKENEVPVLVKTVIFRVIQEAMNNIAKHSNADLVRLSLKKKDDRVELIVEDNGIGFDLENTRKGFGLGSMRERTELSEGSFRIESTKGSGTVIRAEWPI